MHFQTLKRSVWFVLGGLLILVGAACAQTVRVDVPFQFTVGEVLMPAGVYTIQKLYSDRSGLESMRGTDQETLGSSDVFTSTPIEERSRKNESDLVFRCFKGECFLSQIWIAGNQVGEQVPLHIPQRLLANEAPAPQEFVLAALR